MIQMDMMIKNQQNINSEHHCLNNTAEKMSTPMAIIYIYT